MSRGSVLVAMSGGVDSSVAAALLAADGWDVVGVTMKMHDAPALDDAHAGCCTVADADDARSVAARLGVDYYVLDLSEPFEAHVRGPFVEEYAAGRTPNPCVECNRHIKFTQLLARADALGIDAVATGHHARLVDGRLRRGVDAAKDQSYVLACLEPGVVDRVLLPIGAMTKADVRAVAAGLGLRTADKAESMEVCFLGGAGKDAYLRTHLAPESGDVVDADGTVVGEHAGAVLYTPGQRRGVGVATGDRVYVQDVDVARNVVTIGPRPPQAVAFDGGGATWLVPTAVGAEVLVQTSAHGTSHPGVVARIDGDTVRVAFDAPVPLPAPGQLAAFYDRDDDTVLGAATVAAVTRA